MELVIIPALLITLVFMLIMGNVGIMPGNRKAKN